MAENKELYAITGIKHNKKMTKAGDKIDPAEFTKDELTRLYERGAVGIRFVGESPEAHTTQDFDKLSTATTEGNKEAEVKVEEPEVKTEGTAEVKVEPTATVKPVVAAPTTPTKTNGGTTK